jgi:hypothetical protein
MVSFATRQLAGSGSPVIHTAGDNVSVVAWRSTTILLATCSPSTLGSSIATDDISVGNASEATMAVIQIQRVPARLSLAARSARNAPSDSRADTMIA